MPIYTYTCSQSLDNDVNMENMSVSVDFDSRFDMEYVHSDSVDENKHTECGAGKTGKNKNSIKMPLDDKCFLKKNHGM